MKSKASTPTQYIAELPAERQVVIKKLRQVLRKNLPKGFAETMAYGMLGYVVPLRLYPAGYHCDPKQPLPFINLASQKQHVALYHMGLYDGPLLKWLAAEWPKHTEAKLDLGKCCLRFKKLDQIPYALIGKLAKKVAPSVWIKTYEKAVKR
jgi:hypothetical protein